jgi:hypothetical protein
VPSGRRIVTLLDGRGKCLSHRWLRGFWSFVA